MAKGRFPWPMGDKRRGGPLLGPGGPPEQISIDFEAGQAIPVTSTFGRSTIGWYRNDSGVWVEAAINELRYHNAIPGGGGKGYLPEDAATKLALFPRDLTNAAWVATNITPAKDATGIGNVASSASTLTATAANGTILQSFTRASSDHTFSAFVRRKTGTGQVDITVDGGTTWVDVTSILPSDIKDDPLYVTQILANPSIGFRIVTSGDEIEVDMADLEARFVWTTPLDHTSSTATRGEDNLTDQNIDPPNSGFADVTVPYFIPEIRPAIMDNGGLLRFRTGAGQIQCLNNDLGAIITAGSSYVGERHQYAWSMATSDLIVVDDEGNSATDTTGTPISGTILIGRSSSANSHLRGVVHKITFYTVAQTQSELEDLVS